MNQVLEEIFVKMETLDEDGNVRKVDDCISRPEAVMLENMVRVSQPRVTIEVGLAHGVSALVFCDVLRKEAKNENTIHYAVDPNQSITYRNAAVTALKRAGLEGHLKVLNGPSHIEIPNLIKSGVVVDCAFIDGWHTFDYTLIDFFLVDKMLKRGGYVAFHDVYGKAKQKVIDFVLTHRKYVIANELMRIEQEPFLKTFKFFLWRLFRSPSLLFSWYHWRFQLRNSSGLLILMKVEDFEPNFDFFKNF